MSPSRLLACVVTLAVLLAPSPGLDCFAKAQDPLPCCTHSTPGSQQMGDAPACCQNAPLSSNRGVIAVVSPSPRHVDGLAVLPGPAVHLPSPVVTTDVAAFATPTAPSPPRRPAVLRL